MVVTLLLMTQSLWAAGTTVFSEIKEGRNRFVMEYDVSSREVRFLHYRGWSKDAKYTKSYKVGTDEEVGETKISVQSYLQSIEIPGTSQQTFLQRLEELQYLNMSQCQVIHFHSMSPSGNSNFDKLLSEVERINTLETMGPESFRSVPLFGVSLEDEGEFQIRGVLNKTSDIVKLSVVRVDGDIKEYKVEKNGDDYTLVSPKGETVFIIQPDMNTGNKGHITLMTSKSSGVQNVHKSYFSLNKNERNWKVKSFDPNPEISQNIDSIPLIRFNVEHEPVTRINGTKNFVKSLGVEELEKISSDLNVDKSDFEHISQITKDEFARCMLDRKMVDESQSNSGGRDHRELCLLLAEVEASLEVKKLEAANYLEEFFDTKVILNEAIKTLSEDYRICLGQSKGFEKGKGYLSYDFEYIEKHAEDTREELSKCKEEFSSYIVKMSLEEEIRNDNEIIDVIPEGQIFESFLKQVIEEGYANCLSKKEKQYENCKEFASLYKEGLIFSADISHRFWQKNERTKENVDKHTSLISSFKSCVDKTQKELLEDEEFNFKIAKNTQVECANNLLEGLGGEDKGFNIEEVLQEIPFFSKRQVKVNEEQKAEALELYKECYSEATKKARTSLEEYDSAKHVCSIEATKGIIPELFSASLLEEYSDYILSDDQKISLSKYTNRLIKRRISDLQSAKNIDSALEAEVPTFVAKAVSGTVDFIMRSNFSDEENFVFNSKAQSEISKKIFYLIGGDSNKPLSYELKRFVLKEFEKNGMKGVRLQSNTFLKDFMKEVIPFVAIKEIGNDIFIKADREELAGIVDKEIQACLSKYKADGDIPYKTIYKFCEKKRYGLKEFLLAKRDFETLVSHHLTLTSNAGNRALSPVHYMKECIDGLDKKELEMGDYEKQVGSCVKLTKIKISSNIDRERVKKFKPYTRSQNGGSERYSGATSAYCHNLVFYHLTKEIDDSELSNEVHGKSNDKVQAMLAAGDSIYNDKLMTAIADTPSLDEKWFDDKLTECRDGTHKFLISGLKNYLIQLIPASMYNEKNRVGQTNKEVLESFLDAELLNLLLELKVAKGDKGGELNSAEVDPSQKVVTSTLTLNALSNFMKILGTYITDGFIYEKDKMKTELVIFREELKTALKWVNNQERPIRIAELGDFFTESNLADHMAQAMVSEMVRDNFMSFLSDMEKNELRSARQGSGHTQAAVKAKFKKLRAHTKKMTAYYDFSHVIRPKSIKGDRLLKLIKENYLLPKLIGDKVSSYSIEKIHNDVASMILNDSTEGGFAELFVKEVAQLELSKKKDSHWGITRFLFYDNGDFDWPSIRKTEAGKRAIDFYGRNILLPRMLGKKLSSYEENLRMKRFKGILDDAISEND